MEGANELNLEGVFIAANVREIEFVRRLLDDEGIEYSVRPEAFTRSVPFASDAYQGLLFEVIAGQAEYCRRLISEKGLGHGVVTLPR